MSDAEKFRAAMATSTDPARLERMAQKAEAREKIDGRRSRGERTREKIIATCREMMLAGDFRPTMLGVSKKAGCAVRSVFQHFKDVEALHLAALDRETQDGILLLIVGDARVETPVCIVWAAVFGRPYVSKAVTSESDVAVGHTAEAAP